MEPASPPTCSNKFSSHSRKSRPRWIARAADWASGWRWCAAWCKCTAARCGPKARVCHGSRFVVTLPIVMHEPTGNDDGWRPTLMEARRVLVVDDNENAAQTLGLLLAKLWGHDVKLAYDGLAAVELARQ